MILYKIINRQLVLQRRLTAAELATLSTDWDSWLKARGFGRDFTLRAGVVREPSRGEIMALGRPSVRVPSAASLILAKLEQSKR